MPVSYCAGEHGDVKDAATAKRSTYGAHAAVLLPQSRPQTILQPSKQRSWSVTIPFLSPLHPSHRLQPQKNYRYYQCYVSSRLVVARIVSLRGKL